MAKSRCSTRNYLAPCGQEEVELQHEGCRLDANCAVSLPLMEYIQPKPVNIMCRLALLEWKYPFGEQIWKENMQPKWSKGRERKKLSVTPRTTYSRGRPRLKKQCPELHSWHNASSAPGLEWWRVGGYSDATVGLSPKESTVTAWDATNDMSMVFLSNDSEEKNTIEKNKTMFLNTVDQEGWQNSCWSSIRSWSGTVMLKSSRRNHGTQWWHSESL